MKDFKRVLYEALLVAFGKILAKYNSFAQSSILKDVGKELIDYLNEHGLGFEETGTMEDISTLIDLFVKNGFAERLEVEPADRGKSYVWHNLYGVDAYEKLQRITDNPYLSCPLNVALYYLAQKQKKAMVTHKKNFNMQRRVVESQYEFVDADEVPAGAFDPLVIENARLVELAQEKAEKLEAAQRELKVLKGIVPICSYCKRIRDERGEWRQVDEYMRAHTEADFTHGVCPDCYEKARREAAGST
jgi:hypothetical protein